MTGILASIAFRNVLRHGKRTLITALVLTVGLGMFIFFDSILAGMDRMTIDSMVDYTESSVQLMSAGYAKNRRALPLEYGIANPGEIMERLSAVLPEAQAATPRTAFLATASNRQDSVPVFATAIDPEMDTKVFRIAEHMKEGEWLSAGSGDNEVAIGSGLAKDLGLAAGDWLILSARTVDDSLNADEFLITAVLDAPAQELTQSGVFISYTAARALLGDDLPVTTIAISLPKESTLDTQLARSVAASTALKSAFPGMETRSIAEASTDYMAMRNMKAKYSSMIILVVLLIAGVGIVNTVLMSVYSRIKEIGVLRAYGMQPVQIRRLFSLEGMMIGAIGSMGGVILGVLLTWWSVRWGLDISRFFGDLDMGSIPLGDSLRGEWHPQMIAMAFVFGVFASWISARIPARKAGKLEVTDALHFV